MNTSLPLQHTDQIPHSFALAAKQKWPITFLAGNPAFFLLSSLSRGMNAGCRAPHPHRFVREELLHTAPALGNK